MAERKGAVLEVRLFLRTWVAEARLFGGYYFSCLEADVD